MSGNDKRKRKQRAKGNEMKKSELEKMLEAAKEHYESSNRWYGYKLEAEERGNANYAETCERVSYEDEFKARGICEVIAMLTGYEFSSWNFIYSDEYENTKRICGIS